MNDDASTDFAADAIGRFQAVLDNFIDRLGNLGALAAIDIRGADRFYLAAGHADIGRIQRAGRQHLFQMGSQSKTFVSVALVLMARSGELSLDDPVTTHLNLPIDARITVRHLLMNSSGLGEYTRTFLPDRYDPTIVTTPRDLIGLALPQGQLFAPGDRFDYSNTGWVIAAQIIEKVRRRPYHEVLNELVLTPLGLTDTVFGGIVPKHRMMRGYLDSAVRAEPIDVADSLSWAYGAGDGVSSLDDMLDFYSGLIKADSPIAITLADLNQDTVAPSDNPYNAMSIGGNYGLGIEQRAWAGREVWGHPGSTMAYMSSTWVDAAAGVTVTTCVTRVTSVAAADADIRYPRAQLFAMALNTAYALADRIAQTPSRPAERADRLASQQT